MMGRLYQSVSTVASIPVGISWVKILGGNSRRLAILFAPNPITTFYVSQNIPTLSQIGFAVIAQSNGFRMKYHDYGPLIQGDVFVASSSGAFALTTTEIFII